jgi:hypothetical protein
MTTKPISANQVLLLVPPLAGTVNRELVLLLCRSATQRSNTFWISGSHTWTSTFWHIDWRVTIIPSCFRTACPKHGPVRHKIIIYLWLYSPLLGLGRFFSFFIFYTVGKSPWTGDQPVAKPLATQDSTNTEKTHTDIHALSGIRTNDPSV